MAFCMNCGTQLPEGAKFCSECGTPLGKANTESAPKRETVFEGKIFKCPNCGDILDAYESVCESCGYERRGAKATSSVRELSAKLQAIEAQRPPKKHTSIFSQALNQGHISKTDEQKIDLIKNFAIPNNKEDILEFAVLAVSNIDPDAFSTMNNASIYDSSKKAISNAWMAKFEQAYQKGKLMFGESPELNNIYLMYLDKKKTIKKKKSGVWKILGIVGIVYFAIIAVILISINISDSTSKTQEEARLNNLVQQIEIALDSEDYDLALMYAARLDYSGPNDKDEERDWAIQQEYWINKIIAEAAKNGIVLERPTINNSSDQTSAEVNDAGEIRIGTTQYGFKYKNFLEIKTELENKGFTNVRTEGLKDLKSSMWESSKDGQIEKVAIDGETGFTENIYYAPNVEIVIYYHSFAD